MSKRQRSDSLSSQIRFLSGREIKPPDEMPLDNGAEPFWKRIVRARASDTWTDIDLVNAAVLANTYLDIKELRDEIKNEGKTIKNERGTVVSNPKVAQLETVCRRSVALCRSLHVHAEATQGRARDTGARTKKEKELLDSMPDNDLLAKPESIN